MALNEKSTPFSLAAFSKSLRILVAISSYSSWISIAYLREIPPLSCTSLPNTEITSIFTSNFCAIFKASSNATLEYWDTSYGTKIFEGNTTQNLFWFLNLVLFFIFYTLKGTKVVYAIIVLWLQKIIRYDFS